MDLTYINIFYHFASNFQEIQFAMFEFLKVACWFAFLKDKYLLFPRTLQE